MAQKQKMKVKVYTWLSHLLDKANPTRYYKPALVTPPVIVMEKFLQNVASETGLSIYQARAVLSSIVRTAGDYMEAGNAVELDEDFGTLKPFLRVKGTAVREKCNSEMIVGVGIKFIPKGKMKALLADTQFQFVGMTEGGDVDDSEVVGPNTGNQQQGPQEIVYTFVFHDNTEDSRSGQPGEAVNAPTADTGYEWDDVVPTVFGNESKTFREVLLQQGAPKYNVTYKDQNDNVVETREYEVGERIVDPEPPAGYIWNYHPNNMPAENLVVNCLKDE